MPMSQGRSKRLSSFFAFLRPRKGKDKSDAGSVSLRSRAATPSPPSVAEKTEKSPTSPTSPSTTSLVSPIYDASQTKTNMANMSRVSGLNEVDVASFPLPPSLPPTKDKVVTRSESTPVFSHLDLDLTLSNPASPISPISTRASTSTLSKQSGFLRRASSAGLRIQSPKSRPQSFLPPAPIPQIDIKFDVGRMDVDFAPPKPAQSRSTTTL
ncbi:hypothetical protein CcaverHIS002_0501800 [Cutaneotrichosporon cavernicola]|nr:hypothetical protein CcaverHIS002_0501800 [Cutaneotrichosporon cavernicola]BEJ00386.1 hypothetical protein CcaverHIS631_0502430 [Cutaneotrichosporon cavernicola]BEJ08156.1 hypothetical protein CcaverHIS641_0502410 [Cutaneotrichosporon cavernicola]